MRRLAGGLLKWSWYLAAIVLVLCAALVSLGQYYFPYLGEHEEELLARVAAELPFGVEVAGLDAEWTGLAPTLRVNGLRLFVRDAPDVTILSASRSELRIDMLRSLFSLAPRLRRISADDVQLGFSEDAEGRWHITGAGGRREAAERDAIIDFFLAIEEIELRRTRLVLSANAGGRVETEGAELSMENYRRFRRVHATFRDEVPGGEFELLLESFGDPRERGEFSAAAHLRLDNARLTRLQPLLPPGRRLPDAALDGELWAELSEEGLVRLRGALRSAELDPRAFWPQHDALQPLHDVDLSFGAEWSGSKGTLWLEELRCQWFGQPLELERVRIDAAHADGAVHVGAGADYLDLGALAGAVQGSTLLTGGWSEALADLAPYGGLANARLDLSLPAEGSPDFRFRAAMIDVSASPWRSAPGVRNVRGYLEITPRGGRADIDSAAVSLEFPRLYHHDLDFDSLAGRVSWQRGAAGVQFGSELLRMASGQSEFSARFDLDLPSDPAADDQLSLSIGLRDADLGEYRTFLPNGASPALRAWLDAGVEAGHVDSAALAYHAIFSRPDRPFSYALQLGLEVRDVALSYHPDWPAVSAVTGRVLVDGRDVRVWAGSGRMLGGTLADTVVEVVPQAAEQRLRVRAKFDGDAADGLKVLNDSPVAAMTGGALRDWRASGPMALALELDMPFGGELAPQSSRLAVAADIAGAELFIAGLRLQFDGVRGPLAFDLERGLHSERIDGMLWGKPIRAAIGARDPQSRLTAIRLDGSVELPRVAAWLDSDAAGLLSGETPITVDVLQQEQQGFGFVVRSELRGAASALPAPLTKAPDEALALELRWTPVADGVDIGLQLGSGIEGAMHADGRGQIGGEIALGAEPVPGGGDLRITGRLERADVGAWVAAVQRIMAANAARGPGWGEGLRFAGLEAGSATLAGAELHGLRLDSRREEGDFVLGFAAAELAGELRLPAAASSPYSLVLERVQLRPFLGASAPADAGAGEVATELPPARDRKAWDALEGVQVPATEVHVRSASLDARDLGEWSFRIGSEVDALALTRVQGRMPGLEVAGTDGNGAGSFRLRWIAGEPRSELALGLRSEDIAAFFGAWGYTKVLEARHGSADVDFQWPGDPTQFDMAAVLGSMDFSWRDGRLLLESGNNPFMRGLGMLNFDEVLRRLRLDFKDLYQSGLAFDRFEGGIELGEGFARTREPVTLEGPSARIRFSGRSDLRSRTIDAELIVTLPIGSNLPWVAALAGGLPAAAGAYVASRIFENQLGKFSSAVYKVSGALGEPRLEFVKVFDTKEPRRGDGAVPAAGAAPAAADGAGTQLPAAEGGAGPAEPATVPATATAPAAQP